MPLAERELFDVVRAITVHTFRPLNGAKLGPLLQEFGITATPTIHEVYNIIEA